jgi:hypothetical protein
MQWTKCITDPLWAAWAEGEPLAMRNVLLASMVVLSIACGQEIPTAPTSTVPPAPPVTPTPPRSANYEVIFVADSRCADLPSAVRTRTYAGTLDGFRLGLSGAEFGADWNVMSLTLDGDVAYVYATDPPILERPTPDTDLVIDGTGVGSVLRDGSVTFVFRGIVNYCSSVDRAESRQSKCDVPRIRCESNDHRLRLTAK